jgi:hypothetical protein
MISFMPEEAHGTRPIGLRRSLSPARAWTPLPIAEGPAIGMSPPVAGCAMAGLGSQTPVADGPPAGSYVALGRGRRIVSIAPSAGRPKDAMPMHEAIAFARAALAA